MPFETFWTWLENTPMAYRIGESWWFPLLESLHVVGITLVVGAILMVDLRLLGLAARSYAVSKLSKDLLPWAWAAFLLSIVTGVGLFMTRATHYLDNTAFQFKLALLLLAGINMALFHFVVARDVVRWDDATSTPAAAKLASVASLLIWSGAMLAGRWVGHLTG